ncbi:MAG: hypothetical protein V1886_03100 [archaeon]
MKISGRNKILYSIGLAGLILCSAAIIRHEKSKLEEKLLNSSKAAAITDKTQKTENWIKYNSQNQAVFSENVGNQKPNYEIVISDMDGNNKQILTHHPFEDRYPLWVTDNEIAFERIGQDSGREIKTYHIINTETGNFKLIKQDEYSLLKEKSK